MNFAHKKNITLNFKTIKELNNFITNLTFNNKIKITILAKVNDEQNDTIYHSLIFSSILYDINIFNKMLKENLELFQNKYNEYFILEHFLVKIYFLVEDENEINILKNEINNVYNVNMSLYRKIIIYIQKKSLKVINTITNWIHKL